MKDKDPTNNEITEDEYDSFEEYEKDMQWAEITAQMAEDYIWG